MAVTLSIYTKDQYYQLPIEDNSRVMIGSAKRDTLVLRDVGLDESHLTFSSKSGMIRLSAKPGIFQNGVEIQDSTAAVGDVFSSADVSIYVCPKQQDYEQSVTLTADREIFIGRSKECSLCFSNKRVSSRHAKIVFESGKYKLIDLDSKNHTFVNGKRINSYYLQNGDMISIAYYSILYDNGELAFFNTGSDLKINLDKTSIARKYPLFRRSPRLGQTYERKSLVIQPPPAEHGRPEINWLAVFLPPVVMIGVSVASVLLTEGSLTSLLFLIPTSLVTVLTTVVSYITQRRKHTKERRRKKAHYEEYINSVLAEINEDYSQQLTAVNSANPDTEYCRDIVSSRMRRLWERSPGDPDFLSVRLGYGTLPLNVDISFPQTPIGEEESPQIRQLRERIAPLSSVKDIAITLPVKSARSVGIVGSRQAAVHMVKNMLIQFTTHHSYADINLIVTASEKDYEQWAWARWLPHTWTAGRQLCCVSAKKAQAAELLNEWEDILKKRVQAVRDSDGSHLLLPYLVFVIPDSTLVENREFVKLISSAGNQMGVCALLLFDSLAKLPKDCDWFVELSNSGGSMYSRINSENKTAFKLDSFDGYEQFARSMAPIRDRLAEKDSQLPASVTFFEGYGVRQPEEINIAANWASSKPHRSLAAPVGIKENGKVFLFDIHEKAHGPHGLVAGTTGSGKSEVLQSWILSMCVSFMPQDVSFVLIDFKGMGLAGALKGLPHIAGTISDVDENIQRNLFSLESELSRRKLLFAEASSDAMKIGDIYDYQEAFRRGDVSEPLAHLIIVVDEFAELKSKYPEFMAALDSSARVGRSLGVHLVLATQKPDGVVTDEVRANAKFKWCLRVANEAESKAVMNRPEAAYISSASPGRVYIQIGNNEVFEQVQTYYSGGPIKGEQDAAEQIFLAFVDAIGRREYMGGGARENGAQHEKELLALVKWISKVHASSGLSPARKIWESSLPKRLDLSQIPMPVGEKPLLSAVIGIVDDPRHQRQYPCQIDFAADGHIMIYGAPGTGKTFLLQTIIMSLAARYTPDEVNIYVMDFGSWSMKNLQSLPHIGGIANGNEEEKLVNLTKMLNEMLDRRKTLFAQIGASGLSSYRKASGKCIPAIMVLVDNFAPIREMYPDMEHVFVRLSREGSGYGIFLVVTAASLTGSVGYQLTQNFKQALSLRMTECADYRDIVGDTEGLEPAKIPGRGLVRGKPPMEFQTALAVEAADDIEYVTNLKERCSAIASRWKGALPEEIPVMPEIVLFQHLKNVALDRISLGLSDEGIAPVAIPSDTRLTIISGTEESGKTNLLRMIERQLRTAQNTIYIDAGDAEDRVRIAPALKKASDGEQVTLLLDNYTQWLSSASYEDSDLIETLVRSIKSNRFTLYASADATELAQEGGSLAGRLIQSGSSILLGGSFNEHSSQFEATNLGYSEQGKQLDAYYGYLIQKKKAVKFKVIFAGGSGTDGL